MKIILYILIVLILLSSQSVFSQKEWTLGECIQYAVSNNLDVKKSDIQNEINRESLNQSKRNLLPYVSIGMSGSNYFGKSLDYDTYEYINTSQVYSNVGFYSGIDIFRGFTRQNTISFRKMNYLAGMEDEKMQKYDLAFSVMEAYYNAVYYNGLMEIVKEQKELSEMNLRQTQKQVDLGLKAKSDLLEMESRLAKEELTLIQTQNFYKTAVLNLKQAMNLNPEGDFKIDLLSPDMIPASTESRPASDIYSGALDFYPTIRAGELRKQAAQKNLSIAKGGLWPSLTMSGSYSSYYAKLKGKDNTESLRNQLDNNASQSVGLSLNIPVFQRFGLRSDVKQARLNYLRAQTELVKTSQQLLNEITQNAQELESFWAEYNQLVKQVDFAQVAYDAAEKKLAQGLISVIELYDSKNIMAQAKSDLLRTKLQYTIKQKTMDVYLGKPVFGFLP
ncbi:TolC family protein [Maribellus sp. YY47]|uniref:TolC family protein n=1 Tax=Maribellus sp. YY47 TaxID=2929486 RepID=UPI002000B0C8|nr:TolC family protein [Maribellus sp. YY47]MCK3682914.1 TolC family protein [Maribellus sp. YY47]